jgi:hypothetical protein
MQTTRTRNLPATTLAVVANPQPAADPAIGIPYAVRTTGAAALCTRLGRVMLSLACVCCLFGAPVFAQQQAPQKAAGGTLTIDLAAAHPRADREQQDLLFQ